MTAQVIPMRQGGVDPEDRAAELARQFIGARAEDILEHAINHAFLDEIALVSSFGAESAVLLHLVSRVNPGTPVVFLETQKHFAQTISYRKKLSAQLGLTDVRDIKPATEEVAAEDPGGDLWRRDTDACCNLRKVRPLKGALDGFDAWITGRKAFHSEGRALLPTFEWNGTHFKVNPIVSWSPDDVSAYVEAHDLPPHPLMAQGYPSIGCWPCTQPVAEGDDVRAGRWRGQAKTECGIHVR
ncbi:MAG: phosphoadenylyl-sulfate reductase [Pseudomonadota bacterium]